MFRPAHAAAGTLTEAMRSSDNTLAPTAQLFTEVSRVLINPGDTTYLQVGDAPWVEIVRVDNYIPGVFIVSRGIDSTIPNAFPVGTPVRYVLPVEAIDVMMRDVVQSLGVPASLVFTINAPNSVSVVGSDVNINIVPTNITSPDGTVDVTGSGNSVGVSVVRGAFGCCD